MKAAKLVINDDTQGYLEIIDTIKKTNPEEMRIIRPDLTLRDAFYRYCDAFRAVKEPGQWLEKLAHEDFVLYIQRLKDVELGLELPYGFVPSSMYWLIKEDNKIIGNSSLRHYLTPALEDLGGHIGYRIHPQERRKGYGTILLKMMLEKAREIGLKKVLITCDTDNVASAGVILNNGGVLASQGKSNRTDKPVSRYWIDLYQRDEH
jgi:predicted acetyltransferase